MIVYVLETKGRYHHHMKLFDTFEAAVAEGREWLGNSEDFDMKRREMEPANGERWWGTRYNGFSTTNAVVTRQDDVAQDGWFEING